MSPMNSLTLTKGQPWFTGRPWLEPDLPGEFRRHDLELGVTIIFEAPFWFRLGLFRQSSEAPV